MAALFVRDELLIKRAAVIVDPGDPHSKYLQAAFEKKFSDTGGVLIGSHAMSEINDSLLRPVYVNTIKNGLLDSVVKVY